MTGQEFKQWLDGYVEGGGKSLKKVREKSEKISDIPASYYPYLHSWPYQPWTFYTCTSNGSVGMTSIESNSTISTINLSDESSAWQQAAADSFWRIEGENDARS